MHENPSGVRVGTPAMTTRGFGPQEFKQVAAFIKEAVDICCEIQGASAAFNRSATRLPSVELERSEADGL